MRTASPTATPPTHRARTALAASAREAERIAAWLEALSDTLARAEARDDVTPALAIALQQGLDELRAQHGLASVLADGHHVGLALAPAVRAVAQLVIVETGADRCQSFGRAVAGEEPRMLPTELVTLPGPPPAPEWSEGLGLILLGLQLVGGALARSCYQQTRPLLAILAHGRRRLREGWS